MDPAALSAIEAMDSLTLSPSTPPSPVPTSSGGESALDPSTEEGEADTTPHTCAGIDHTAFPTIVERICELSEGVALLSIRGTSNHYKNLVEPRLYRHVQVRPRAPTTTPEGHVVTPHDGYTLTSVDAVPLPGMAWGPHNSSEKQATQVRLNSHTKIVDFCPLPHHSPKDSTYEENQDLFSARRSDLQLLCFSLRHHATTIRHAHHDESRRPVLPDIREMWAKTMITFTTFEDMAFGDSYHRCNIYHPNRLTTSIVTVLHDYSATGRKTAGWLGNLLRFPNQEGNRAFIFFAPPNGSWSETPEAKRYNLALDIAKLVVHQAAAEHNQDSAGKHNYSLYIAGLDSLPAALLGVDVDPALNWDARKVALFDKIKELIPTAVEKRPTMYRIPPDEDLDLKFDELELISDDEFRQAVGGEHYRLSHPGDDIVLLNGVKWAERSPSKSHVLPLADIRARTE